MVQEVLAGARCNGDIVSDCSHAHIDAAALPMADGCGRALQMAGSPTSAHAQGLTARGSLEDDSSPASAPAGTPMGQPVSPAYATAAMPRSRSAGMLPVSARRRVAIDL